MQYVDLEATRRDNVAAALRALKSQLATRGQADSNDLFCSLSAHVCPVRAFQGVARFCSGHGIRIQLYSWFMHGCNVIYRTTSAFRKASAYRVAPVLHPCQLCSLQHAFPVAGVKVVLLWLGLPLVVLCTGCLEC